jgi:DNA mismatch endonuclease (patch repair protein)
MVDNVSKKRRSEVMSCVKSKDTGPEMRVRQFLHSHGFRYRLHVKDLPGKPDIVLPKYRKVLFVNGCFWHGHEGPNCKLARIPKSNVKFWKSKIQKNHERDSVNTKKLEKLGWKVLVVWECQINKQYLRELPKVIVGL